MLGLQSWNNYANHLAKAKLVKCLDLERPKPSETSRKCHVSHADKQHRPARHTGQHCLELSLKIVTYFEVATNI